MSVIPVPIKISQTNQADGGKVKGSAQAIAQPNTNSFIKIFETFQDFHKSPEAILQKESAPQENIADENNRLIDADTGEFQNLKTIIDSLAAKVKGIQKLKVTMEDQTLPGFNETVSPFHVKDLSDVFNSRDQLATQDIKIYLPLLQQIALEMKNEDTSQFTELIQQAEDLIEELELEDQENENEILNFDVFPGFQAPLQFKEITSDSLSNIRNDCSKTCGRTRVITAQDYAENQSLMTKKEEAPKFLSSYEMKAEKLPLKNYFEKQPIANTYETIVNQQQHPKKMNVENAHATRLYDVPVSRLIPEVSGRIEGFLKNLPDNTGKTEIKISLTPESLGTVGIKVKADKGKIAVQIVTDTPSSKELLESKLFQIKQGLDSRVFACKNSIPLSRTGNPEI